MLARLDALADPRFVRTFALAFAACLALTILAAIFSDGVYHADEYFQISEFVGLKLGRLTGADLPWEYGSRVRPWLQPGIYYVVARLLEAVSVHDAFTMMLAFRLLTGLTGVAALMLLALLATTWVDDGARRRAIAVTTALTCFVPYLLVRTTSESLSAAFFVGGFALLSLWLGARGREPGPQGAAWPFLAGLLFGLAFECRYQMAVPVVGFTVWAIKERRLGVTPVVWLALGVALSVLGGSVIDAWGYGEPVFVPWNYLRVNLIEGKAAEFGVSPFYAYLYLMPALLPPWGLLATLTLVVFWWQNPRHSLTWVSLPLVLVHCLIGHKEERFLFPIYGMIPAMFVLVSWRSAWHLVPPEKSLAPIRAPIRVGVYCLNFVFLAALVTLPVRVPIKTARFIYRAFPDRFEVYTIGRYDPVSIWHRSLRFAAPPAYVRHGLDGLDAVVKASNESPAPIYYASRLPLTDEDQARFAGRPALVYSFRPRFLDALGSFKWVDRIDWACLYRIEPPPR
ncbi:MAG: hypothetical protein HY903_07490 [Deltaproteobacteria bacterium]|nr:hypothetical protein [Deltaproteobacteria bacterium]